MLRVTILGLVSFTVFFGLITVLPMLESEIPGPQQYALATIPLTPSCAISAHPDVINRGEEASIAWWSENALYAVLSGVGEVPLKGGSFIAPLTTGDYLLSVVSATGEWAYCSTSITVM